MEARYLSTAEAARKAGVAVSSLKRWSDDGLLPCSRTAGGHRRFLERDLERFLAEQDARTREGTPSTSDRWIALMLERDSHALMGGLHGARARLGAWHRVADELGSALVRLGERWRQGEVTVLQEHLATEQLHRAVSQVGLGLVTAPDAPACLLATAEGEEHTLGLTLADLCLREAGWRPLWAGRRTPMTELVRAVREESAQMVALSASEAFSQRSRLTQQLRPLIAACTEHDVPLVLGGRGPWPETDATPLRLTNFREFHRLLLDLQESSE